MRKLGNILVLLFASCVLMFLSGCAGYLYTPTPQVALPPSLSVSGIPQSANTPFTMNVTSQSQTVIIVIIDETVLVQTGGPQLTQQLDLPEGNHVIKVVARDGITGAESTFVTNVTVDKSAPNAANLYANIQRGILKVSGLLSEPAYISCFGVVGNTNSADNSFEIEIPTNTLQASSVLSSIQLDTFDSLGNHSIWQIQVKQDPNRWERWSSNGTLIQVVTTPGFDPYSINQVGWETFLFGYGGDAWIQYTNESPNTDSKPAWWFVAKAIPISLILAAALVIAFRSINAVQKGKRYQSPPRMTQQCRPELQAPSDLGTLSTRTLEIMTRLPANWPHERALRVSGLFATREYEQCNKGEKR